MKIIVVTAAIIEKEGKILLAQRREDSDEELKWEFPGGKLEFGETPEECLKREIREELDIEIETEKIFQVVSHVYGERQIVLLCYLCRYIEGNIKPKECRDYCFVEKQHLLTYDLAPADIPVAKKLSEACTTSFLQ